MNCHAWSLMIKADFNSHHLNFFFDNFRYVAFRFQPLLTMSVSCKPLPKLIQSPSPQTETNHSLGISHGRRREGGALLKKS